MHNVGKMCLLYCDVADEFMHKFNMQSSKFFSENFTPVPQEFLLGWWYGVDTVSFFKWHSQWYSVREMDLHCHAWDCQLLFILHYRVKQVT